MSNLVDFLYVAVAHLALGILIQCFERLCAGCYTVVEENCGMRVSGWRIPMR